MTFRSLFYSFENKIALFYLLCNANLIIMDPGKFIGPKWMFLLFFILFMACKKEELPTEDPAIVMITVTGGRITDISSCRGDSCRSLTSLLYTDSVVTVTHHHYKKILYTIGDNGFAASSIEIADGMEASSRTYYIYDDEGHLIAHARGVFPAPTSGSYDPEIGPRYYGDTLLSSTVIYRYNNGDLVYKRDKFASLIYSCLFTTYRPSDVLFKLDYDNYGLLGVPGIHLKGYEGYGMSCDFCRFRVVEKHEINFTYEVDDMGYVIRIKKKENWCDPASMTESEVNYQLVFY